MSQFKPQKSFIAPNTVEARIELVPNPEPAGIADNSVTSIPAPNERNFSSSEVHLSAEKSGWKPASTNAALGIEKGEPTLLNVCSSSKVVITSIAPKSMERRMILYSLQGLT